MSGRMTIVAALIAAMSTSMPAYCEPPQVSLQVTSEALIDDFLAFSKIVLEHHMRPPVRQQIILAVARTLYEERGAAVPEDLALKCSISTEESQFRQILREAFGDAMVWDYSEVTGLCRSVSAVVQECVAGDVRIETRKSGTASRQLAENRYVGVGIAVTGKSQGVMQIRTSIPGGPCIELEFPRRRRFWRSMAGRCNTERWKRLSNDCVVRKAPSCAEDSAARDVSN